MREGREVEGTGGGGVGGGGEEGREEREERESGEVCVEGALGVGRMEVFVGHSWLFFLSDRDTKF